jgi:hypothetical protein
MNRRLAVALLLALLPAAAVAQGSGEHKEHGKTAEQQMAHHEALVQSIVAKRAELNLTDAQVEKLNAFKTKVSEHHKTMMKEGAHGMSHSGTATKSDAPAMAKMHEEFSGHFHRGAARESRRAGEGSHGEVQVRRDAVQARKLVSPL